MRFTALGLTSVNAWFSDAVDWIATQTPPTDPIVDSLESPLDEPSNLTKSGTALMITEPEDAQPEVEVTEMPVKSDEIETDEDQEDTESS